MKDLKTYIVIESVECIETRKDLEKYLTNNDIKFTIDKEGRYDKSYDIIIDTKYEGVKVIYGFIGKVEYLASLEKDGKEIMYFESSKELSYRNEFTVKFLDPIAYFNDCLKKLIYSFNEVKPFSLASLFNSNISSKLFVSFESNILAIFSAAVVSDDCR
jgi:hypothetical protein